jgi:hypothetical protein
MIQNFSGTGAAASNFNYPLTTDGPGKTIVELDILAFSDASNTIASSVKYDNISVSASNPFSSIQENSAKAYSIYPNPAKESITVSLTENSLKSEITLLSSEGKIIEIRKSHNLTEEIFDLKNLDSGIYFIKIGAQTEKIIVE